MTVYDVAERFMSREESNPNYHRMLQSVVNYHKFGNVNEQQRIFITNIHVNLAFRRVSLTCKVTERTVSA